MNPKTTKWLTWNECRSRRTYLEACAAPSHTMGYALGGTTISCEVFLRNEPEGLRLPNDSRQLICPRAELLVKKQSRHAYNVTTNRSAARPVTQLPEIAAAALPKCSSYDRTVNLVVPDTRRLARSSSFPYSFTPRHCHHYYYCCRPRQLTMSQPFRVCA